VPISIASEVRSYLAATVDRFAPGSDEHFARLSLQLALTAFEGGNYGIGAVAVLRKGGSLDVHFGQNKMVSGTGLVDHAETRALLHLAGTADPDEVIPAPANYSLASGHIAVFGTLEPCPMCASVMTNAGVTRSVSTVVDGQLVRQGEFMVSDGAANVLDEKHLIQPMVWRAIQQNRGLRFQDLASDDTQLHDLSLRVFTDTRQQIDQALASRNPVGAYDGMREVYANRLP